MNKANINGTFEDNREFASTLYFASTVLALLMNTGCVMGNKMPTYVKYTLL